jgi:parallel beta-helix repeat protein
MDCLAINLGPASDIYVARNHIIDHHGISIRIGDVIAITIRSNYLRVTQPDRVNASGVHVTASRNVTITENVVTGTQRGFVIVDTISVTLTNNNVDCAAKQLEQDMNGILILSCSQAKLINNTVLNARYFGLTIGKSPDTIVSLNTVQRSMLSGIHIWSCNGSVIQRNIAANNGQYQFSYDRQGIALSSSFNCTIDGNRGFDGQLTKTQSYGFVEKGTSDYNTVTNNDFRYNRVGAMRIIGMHTVAKNNLG